MRIFSVEKEEYLKLISHYQMRDGIARTGVLAKKLGITKSSVTEMFQRLAEEDFVKYTAYQGVSLTEKAMRHIDYLEKKQTLLTKFLESCLDCSEKEIVEILDELEHIDNELFFDKLEQYLENHSS